MADKVDDLILQVQHLGASARAQRRARFWEASAGKLKSAAMRVAAASQKELDEAQARLAEGEEKLERGRAPGLDVRDAADLLREGQRLVDENKSKVVKARAKLNFALDRLEEADRAAWQALQAEANAETHAALADELQPGGALSTHTGPKGD